MRRVTCKAVKKGEVPRRGDPTIEFYKDGVPQYYCYGYVDEGTDELLETCRNCMDNVIYAQKDLEEWKNQSEIWEEI